jgi:DNA-binding beta-propeller fold protein YncE
MKVHFAVTAACALLALAPAGARVETLALKADVTVTIPGGKGGFDWMQVDGHMNRLFATHKGTKTVAVIDLTTDKPLPSLEVGTAQGIAIDRKDNKIFFGDDEEHKVVIVDYKTLAKTGEIAVTGPVDDVEYDGTNGMIYADHDDGTDVWVIDAKTEKIVATVTIPEAPEYLQYDKPTDRLYQNIKSNNTIQVIDPAKNTVESVWNTAPATGPHGLAIDHKTGRVFSAGNNGKLVVFDIKTGKMITSTDIAKGVDQIAFDRGNKRIYCSCHGAISVLEETDEGVKSLGDVPAPAGAHTLTVDVKTHAVWTSYSDANGSYVKKFIVP